MNKVLEVTDAKVHFGGVRAVDGVSLHLEEGGLYGLVGPNGSGKSTLLGALSRMTRLTSGVLQFRGHNYTDEPPAKTARMGIGRTFQTVRLLPGLTVRENVMLGADSRLYGQSVWKSWVLPRRTRACERACLEAAGEAMERLELGEVAERPAGLLPYGSQRRVEMARALAAQPSLLLFDEPTAGMNRGERDQIGEVMRQLKIQGITQILVEHDMQMISDVCDYVFVMNFGRVIAEGTAESVVQNREVQEAYLGKRGEQIVAS